MSLLARITDFTPGAIIQSQPFDDEFNQLVNLLAGVSQNKSIRVISNDSSFAAARFDQRGSSKILELYGDGAEVFGFEKDGDITSPFLTSVGGVFTFTQIPVGPNSTPTSDNQFARKKYVDDRRISFIVGFPISDPSTANTNARDFGSFPIPAGGVYTITKLKLFAREGSHTSGGDITFTFDRLGVGDIGSIDLDNGNGTIGQVYSNDIGDITPAENEIFSVRITARSGTITERNVVACIEGHRTVF
jgi:hypothetical protein